MRQWSSDRADGHNTSLVAAMVAAVALLARLDTTNQLAALFGGSTTHHYVLIDDSYSMSEQVGGGTAFDAAMQAIQRLAGDAAQDRAGAGGEERVAGRLAGRGAAGDPLIRFPFGRCGKVVRAGFHAGDDGAC